MTLIIGMYYLNGNEALIASDSRIMRGTEYTTEQKIAYLTEEPQVVIASSGLKGIESEITERTSEQQKLQRAQTLREIKAIVDEVTRELYYHYKGSPKPTFREDEVLIHSIYGGFTAQKPKLYCLHENGYSEPIKDYLAVGDGNRFANSLLRSLYYPGVSQQRALEICIHAIIQTSKIDAVVDDHPQVAILQNNEVKILNLDDKGHFVLQHARLEDIRRKLNGIEEVRSQVFELMLDGSLESKERLFKAIDEYWLRLSPQQQGGKES